MIASARLPVIQIYDGQCSLIQRALLKIQNETGTPLDINKLKIEQHEIFVDFYYEY